MVSLGSTVRRLRNQAELTQQQLADRVGISASYLSHIEADRKEPRIEILRKLAQELPVWPGLLLGAVVQTEMPEELRPTFEGFVEDVLKASDAAQLALPLEADEPVRASGGPSVRAS